MWSREEEVKLNAMQRTWQHSRRSSSAFSLFEGEHVVEKTLACPAEVPGHDKENCAVLSSSCGSSDVESDHEEEMPNTRSKTILDASNLGDIPARYVIHALEPHQFPVVGVYVDPRVIPGFKFRIVPLPRRNETSKRKYLFDGQGLTLKTIGRGYARRFTFSGKGDNYFYSDNHSEGYAFELEAVSIGDKFTIYDVNHEAQGLLEIVNVDGKQLEIDSSRNRKGIEKKIKVKMTANVEFYDGASHHIPLSGVAICLKERSETNANVIKVVNVNIKHQRFYLLPGYQRRSRRVRVNGEDINDVPTTYTITGLEPYEIPVVGTYVDKRILPGFTYRVRPTNSRKYLFDGKSLKLNTIGMGYAKRFTFDSDSKSNNENFFWSDSYPDGFAFETRAVQEKMRFTIVCNEQTLGEATVFRANLPQAEKYTQDVLEVDGKKSFLKYVHVDVMCHIKLDIKNSGSVDENLMRVYGLAVLKKNARDREAKLDRVESIAFDSQLNLLFARVKAEIMFFPLR